MTSDQSSTGRLKAALEQIRNEIGDEPELVRQAMTDLAALERQNARNQFEGRLEYLRQVNDQRHAALRGIVDYGVQTLKWLFLLNGGAIVIVMAYIGGAVGKTANVSLLTLYAPVVKAVWPFVIGCASVVAASATAFFNFSYSEIALPSTEMLHNFLAPTAAAWPIARAQNIGETPQDFQKRYGWKVGVSRTVAISLATTSGFFFIYGVFRVLRAVLLLAG